MMPLTLLRRTAALRVARATYPVLPMRGFSQSARRLGGGGGDGGHHEDHFDTPGGWLWGVRPGEKLEKEGWEPFMWVLYLTLGATGVMLAFKPDTSLDTWALEEARRRLEKEGILPDPFPEKKE